MLQEVRSGDGREGGRRDRLAAGESAVEVGCTEHGQRSSENHFQKVAIRTTKPCSNSMPLGNISSIIAQSWLLVC